LEFLQILQVAYSKYFCLIKHDLADSLPSAYLLVIRNERPVLL